MIIFYKKMNFLISWKMYIIIINITNINNNKYNKMEYIVFFMLLNDNNVTLEDVINNMNDDCYYYQTLMDINSDIKRTNKNEVILGIIDKLITFNIKLKDIPAKYYTNELILKYYNSYYHKELFDYDNCNTWLTLDLLLYLLKNSENRVILEYIPSCLFDEENERLCNYFCSIMRGIKYIPKDKLNKYAFKYIQKYPDLYDIPTSCQNYGIILYVIRKDSSQLRYVNFDCIPKDEYKQNVCNIAFNLNHESFKYIPEQYQTQEMMECFIKDKSFTNYLYLDSFNCNLLNNELLEIIVTKNIYVIRQHFKKIKLELILNLDNEKINKIFRLLMIEMDVIENSDDSIFGRYKITLKCNEYKDMIDHIGIENICKKNNIELILYTIERFPCYLEFLPKNIINKKEILGYILFYYNIYLQYIKPDIIAPSYLNNLVLKIRSLEHIPKRLQTEDMILYVLNDDIKNQLKYINEDLLTEDIIIRLKYHISDIFKYIPVNKITLKLLNLLSIKIEKKEYEECIICKDENKQFFIGFHCKKTDEHHLCLDCHQQTNECYFRCDLKLDIFVYHDYNNNSYYDYSKIYINTNYKE